MLFRSERKRLLNDEGETTRLLTFCDGVFAIAITLLVLNLQTPTPKPGADLVRQLLDQWPKYISYVASFLLIGIFWINHHRVCRQIKRADRLLLTVNLLFLMCLAVLPFPTAILGQFINQPEKHTAALIYGGTVFVTMVMFDLVWNSAERHDLIDNSIDPQVRQGMERSYLLGTLIYLFAVALSLVSVELSLVLYILIPALYITTPPFEHLLAGKPSGGAEYSTDEAQESGL
jgi:uncharacterized membrane protein